MMRDVELSCRCGAVRGLVRGASSRTTNRMVCYCDDCQAFLHRLGRADLLDSRGGTDIVQVAPSDVTFAQGAERIECLRLSPRGLHRWYAGCCRTPLGNTHSPAVPFIGFAREVFDRALDDRQRDEVFGKPRGTAGGQYAVGGPPEGSGTLLMLVHAVRLVLGWKLRGKAWPHPYFDRTTRAAVRPPQVLSANERAALRPLCGPHPVSPR